jgi:hypothetical protein
LIKSTDHLQINCPLPTQVNIYQLNKKYGFGPGVIDLFYDLKNYGSCRSYSSERIFEVAAILSQERLEFSISKWQ